MKLKEWADKEGISYITAYRWFKAGKLPVSAYQAESGTIIVEDEAPETLEAVMEDHKLGDSPVSQLLKKTIEISKNGSPVEDLATFIISNFKLANHDVPEAPVMRRRMKPTKEMTQNHFKKFLQPKLKPEGQMFLVNENDLDNVVAASEKASSIEGAINVEFQGAHNFGTIVPAVRLGNNPQVQSIASVMTTAMQPLPNQNLVATPKTYTSLENGAVFTRALADGEVALNSTLSAANATYSVSSSAAPASSFVTNLFTTPDYSLTEDVELENYGTPEPKNEVLVYRPVTYDEARALVNLIASDKGDPLALDRQTKEICKLNRDTYEMMFKMAETNRK